MVRSNGDTHICSAYGKKEEEKKAFKEKAVENYVNRTLEN
jgi:hypothetical protein